MPSASVARRARSVFLVLYRFLRSSVLLKSACMSSVSMVAIVVVLSLTMWRARVKSSARVSSMVLLRSSPVLSMRRLFASLVRLAMLRRLILRFALIIRRRALVLFVLLFRFASLRRIAILLPMVILRIVCFIVLSLVRLPRRRLRVRLRPCLRLLLKVRIAMRRSWLLVILMRIRCFRRLSRFASWRLKRLWRRLILSMRLNLMFVDLGFSANKLRIHCLNFVSSLRSCGAFVPQGDHRLYIVR